MKILYVTTVSNTINAFLVPHIKFLLNKGHSVEIACHISQAFTRELVELGLVHHEISFNRLPISKSNLIAYKSMKRLVIGNQFEVVHVHTPIASFLTRLAAKRLKSTKIIYTAHGFHFHKGSSILSWIVYYPIEKYLSRFTDVLITINNEDYIRAKNNFHAKKTVYIPGVGIDLDSFNISINKAKKRDELGVPSDAFLITSVGELNKNKNHKFVLKALGQINDKDIHYLICGEGNLKKKLLKLSKKLNIENRFHLLGHRSDVNEIYKVSDLFIMPSKREGLPVSLMESILSGLNVLGADTRGINDLIKKDENLYKSECLECLINSIHRIKKDNSNLYILEDELQKDINLKNVIERTYNEINS
jgi:glycosyltransferase involved in cell wall biosynthesis